MPESPHSLHSPLEHRTLKWVGRAGLGLAGFSLVPVAASMLAPAGSTTWAAGQFAVAACASPVPTGWVAGISALWNHVPLVGATIAHGGLAAVAIAGVVGIGSMWLGNYLDKHTSPGAFRWGAVVRWAGLATSALVALPLLLTGIGMGLNFLGAALGVDMLMTAASVVGTVGSNYGAASGLMLATGHALTCALPLGAGGFFAGKEDAIAPTPHIAIPAQLQARLAANPNFYMVHAA